MQAKPHHFLSLRPDHMFFGISETSEMTEVSPRQLRYWEKRGYIAALPKKDGEARKYSLKTVIAISGIKHLTDDGYTLQAAVSKVSEITHEADMVKTFIFQRYQGMTILDGQQVLDLGPLDDAPKQHAYGLIQDGKAFIKIR